MLLVSALVLFVGAVLGTSISSVGKSVGESISSVGKSFREPAVEAAQVLGDSLDSTLRSLEWVAPACSLPRALSASALR
jgi:hypothetical protein